MTIQATCPPHHWIIETAAAKTSKGTCLKCGAEKNFINSPDPAESVWHAPRPDEVARRPRTHWRGETLP